MSKSSAASSESNADNPALESWQEAAECEETVPLLRLADLIAVPVLHGFDVPGGEELESAKDGAGTIAGPIVRTREDLSGNVEVSATKCGDGVFKLTVVLSNSTAAEAPDLLNRDDVLLKSLLSAHTILGVIGGEFISMIDPPEELRTIASNCQNVGTWPVLVGEDNSKDALLSSPIILYDYPQIAPESPGDLFDGTEIDEILALRILTLSDDEKREIRQTDDRAREILERTEAMPAEHFVKLHGVLRGIKPVAEVSEIQTPREDQR
jgi:hydrogenase maturation protease